jgi:nucleoid-associated protein YgaU
MQRGRLNRGFIMAIPDAQLPKMAALYPQNSSASEGVQFDFNPKTIKVGHGASMKDLGPKKAATTDAQQKSAGPTESTSSSDNLTTQQALEKMGMTSLKISDVVFDGDQVLQKCGMLLYWSYAQQKIGPAPKGQTMPIYLTPLIFQWGDFKLGANTTTAIPVIMVKADVTYERFDATGTPIRATVGLDLQPTAANPLKQQNPTSGGLPGRGGHLVVSGETLSGIALTSYGRPGAWRALAEANELDDPLRVRPGSMLYLPSGSELAARGAA